MLYYMIFIYMMFYILPIIIGFMFFLFQCFVFQKSQKRLIRMIPPALCIIVLVCSIHCIVHTPPMGPLGIFGSIYPFILLVAAICGGIGIWIAWLLNR